MRPARYFSIIQLSNSRLLKKYVSFVSDISIVSKPKTDNVTSNQKRKKKMYISTRWIIMCIIIKPCRRKCAAPSWELAHKEGAVYFLL